MKRKELQTAAPPFFALRTFFVARKRGGNFVTLLDISHPHLAKALCALKGALSTKSVKVECSVLGNTKYNQKRLS